MRQQRDVRNLKLYKTYQKERVRHEQHVTAQLTKNI